ncbi:MAG: N-acetylmuramoyl-L-alanine amidase [Pseudomonadota bacterium]
MGWVTEVEAIPEAEPQRRTLVICAGHSSTEPGAVAHGHTEAEVVTGFRDLVSQALQRMGIRHLTDGPSGRNWPLSEAAAIAAGAQIAVEFHCNAAAPSASGTETLSHRDAFPLAGRLCSVTSEVLEIRNRGSKPENAGQHHRLAFVSDGGGIIHELFFLTNRDDLDAYLLRQGQLAWQVAETLAAAARQ